MIRITMPQAGQTMEEGLILTWRKAEGEQVRKGEILLEIETDKATVEVEAEGTGFLRKILCPEGITVPILAPIAILGEPGEDIESGVKAAKEDLKSMLGSNPALIESLGLESRGSAAATGVRPAAARQPEPGKESEFAAGVAQSVKASPAARKIARERGIRLESLMPGSGPGGRIVSTDVPEAAAALTEQGEPARRPITGMRRAIARTLLLSKQTIPHFYMRMTIDAGPLHARYRVEKERLQCTLNDLIVVACARAIRNFPAFRCRIEGDEVVELPAIGIGIAVGMDDGLRVPVIAEADQLSLEQLARESKRIIEAAQRGKLEGVGLGVFTISNLGMFGVEEFSAIINPPEAAILAVGAIRESVIVRDGALRAGRSMTMTLSADHRIIDGLLAAKFLAQLKELLESPQSLAQYS